jgi:hypothetical protein
VDRVEFLTAMLVQMNELDKEKDIDPWLRRFDELDADGSGALDEEVRGAGGGEACTALHCTLYVRGRREGRREVCVCTCLGVPLCACMSVCCVRYVYLSVY